MQIGPMKFTKKWKNMTTKEFNNLKVGNCVPILPYSWSEKYCETQVVEINRTTKRLKLIANNKSFHFSKIKRSVPREKIGSSMAVRPPYDIIEKLERPNANHRLSS